MMFNSLGFLAFFLISYCLIALFNRKKQLRRSSNLLLLLINLVYYAFFDYRCLLILAGLIIWTYYCGLKVSSDKRYLTAGIVLNVAVLFVFKYYGFFAESLIRLFGLREGSLMRIILPIGISFYVFKAIAYLADVYQGRCETETDFVALAVYISFFPEIVAGPISRADQMLKQIKADRNISLEDLSTGIQMFVIGLFKKTVIADNISVFVNEVYRAPNIYSSLTILLCVVAYSVEIYMDFSGYSDMAIGCARMIGFRSEKNFNLPYVSGNVTEFWKRWHMSLSSWLMRYIYIPLGGNRKGRSRQYLNLLLTMALGGLWHGANWTFVVWGIVNGLALIVHKVYASGNNRKEGGIFSILLTFAFVSLVWVLFRANTLTNAMEIYSGLISFRGGIDYYSSWAVFGIAVTFVCTAIAYVRNDKNAYYPLVDLNTVTGLFLFFLLIGLIVGLAYTGANPFIYAAF